MDVIKQAIVDWLREILVGGIISNLSGRIGKLPGVSSKTAYAKVTSGHENHEG